MKISFFLNRVYDNVKCMEQNIFTPSEHSADIYLDISTNSDIRDFAADLVLNEALLAASAAFSNAGERPDAAALFQSRRRWNKCAATDKTICHVSNITVPDCSTPN